MPTKTKTTILITDEAYEELTMTGIEFEEVAPHGNGAELVDLATRLRNLADGGDCLSVAGLRMLADRLDALA